MSSLIENRLIDEYFLFVNPVALGSGKPIFGELDVRQSLKLVKASSFECGMAVLNYKALR